MAALSRVTNIQLVGVMPMRSAESRSRQFDPAELLSDNELARGLGGDDPEAESNLRARVELAAGHLLDAGEPDRAVGFLCNFAVLAARAALEPDLSGVILDLERTALSLDGDGAAEIELLADALRRSSQILRLAPSQLPEQVIGRLRGQPGRRLERLVQAAANYKSGCWLRPVTASLRGSQQVVGYLDGHGTAARFESSGRLLTVDSSGWLLCWNLAAGTPPLPFRIGDGEPTGLASDGVLVAISTREGPIHVVELATGRRRATLRHSGTGATLVVAFTDPGHLATGGTDGLVRLWDAYAGTELDRIDIRELTVHALLPLGDGRLVLGTDPDPKTREAIQLWELRTMRRRAAFGQHDWPVTALDADTREGILLASANDELSVWRLSDLTCMQRITSPNTTFHSVACLAPGRALAGDASGSLRVLGLADGAELRRLSPHSGLVPAIAADPGRRRFATLSYDQTVRVWDIDALDPAESPGHQEAVTTLALTPGGDRLLSGSKDGHVLAWNALTGELMAELGCHEHWVSGIAALPGGLAASAGWDGKVRIWDINHDDQDSPRTAVISTGEKHLTCLACSRDGASAVTASTDGTIGVWDLATGTGRAAIASPDKDIVAIALDGDRVLWVSTGGRLFSWYLKGELRSTEIPRDGRVTACCLDLAAESCVVGLASGRIVEARGDGANTTFEGADCGPAAIARDRGGRVLLTAHGLPQAISDNTARLWLGKDRSAPAAVLVGDVPWTAAAVADDSRHLYLGDDSGAVHLVEVVGRA